MLPTVSNYSLPQGIFQFGSSSVQEAKEKRKSQLEQVRKRRAVIQKQFQEKLKKYHQTTDFL